jgi:rubrerythrin
MITRRTGTENVADGKDTAIEEATMILSRYRTKRTVVQRWVCEVCGMVHTGTAPAACESCGASTALVQLQDLPREMSSRW